MEMRAHWRRRKIPMAVQIPQPLKHAQMAAITMPIAFRGSGGTAGPVAGGGAFSVPNSIAPPIARVARLPAMARTALARMAQWREHEAWPPKRGVEARRLYF